MKINEVAFIGYPVTDVQRAREFYEGLLGLQASMAHQFPETGKWWIEYEIGGVALAISDYWPPTGQSGPTLAFEVDDLDAWKKKLTGEEVKLVFDTMDTPVCRFFCIKDPDGNDLMIHQRKGDCCS
jgi:predicted enzyme related to lactoylglutathione lyase